MTSIIFGANGQDGFYLNQLLQKMGHEVIGVSQKGDFQKIDLTKFEEVSDLIGKYSPDYVFHLAANSTTRHDAMLENHSTISTGTLHILEAVRLYSPGSRVFISGSGLQFKNENRPIKETDPFEARDAYSVSRIQSVYAARYFRTLGIKTYVGYFFNHDSPHRSERHMAKRISAAVKRISEGSAEKIEIGDDSVIKEWAYAGDIVEGIWMLVSQEAISEANISSGKGYSIRDWVDTCFNIIGKDPAKYIEVKQGYTPEYQQLVSDPSLIRSLDFEPKVSFEQLAHMMIYD